MYITVITLIIIAYCTQTNGMQDPAILSDSQITTTDSSSSVSSIRNQPSGSSPFTTTDSQLNITIVMTNPNYPNSPQIGKIDFIEQDSTNVKDYEVYYKTPGGDTFIPFNSNPSSSGPEIFNINDNVIFPDGIFVDEILIIVNKDPSSPINSNMTFKTDVFACFESLGILNTYLICHIYIIH